MYICIEVLQRKCLRIISYFGFRSHPNHLFTEYVLKVPDVIQLHQLQLLYCFLGNSLRTNLRIMFKLNEDVHTHHTRQVFHIPGVNTSIYSDQFN